MNKASTITRDNKKKSNDALFQGSVFTDFSRFYILLLLFEGEEHGYQIMSNIEKRLGQKVSPSLVYPFLKVLEEQGLVRSRERKVGQKTRWVYSLTSSGRSLCDKIFRQFTTIVSSAIEPSMQVCANCGCKVYKDAYSEAIKGKKLMFCCKHCATAYKREEK
jgi:PadR family transcriptional regulator PadR